MKLLGIFAAAALGACLWSCGAARDEGAADTPAGLKDVFKDKFLVGCAVNQYQMAGEDTAATDLVRRHYNTIVAENVMKSEVIHPARDVYDWTLADEFVDWGEANGMFIVGHCLVWHSQLAKWFPYDDNGDYVSADTLKQRMRDHIHAVVGRYKGRVGGWDVVNEAILDDGSYRKSPFYEIIGEEYIPLSFQYAHEADPEAELYINDYSMSNPAKRDRYIEIVNGLRGRGLRVDGIGMQSHMGLDYPDLAEWERSIEEFARTGAKVMVTELDMSALPTITKSADVSESAEYQKQLNPYPDGLPEDIDRQWNQRMDSVMEICLRHADVVTRVNFWGVSDGDSWKNDWPVKGRKEYPLPFDRGHMLKPFAAKYMERGPVQ